MPVIRRAWSNVSIMKHDRTIIIAEAGVNHNGSMEMALGLIDEAARAGVDYVKFQSFRTECLVTRDAPQARYQRRRDADGDGSQYGMLKRLELSEAQHVELMARCRERGVRFLSTAFDAPSIELLSRLDLAIWKIPSGEITNYPYLRRIAREGKPVILSTGMSMLDEVADAVRALEENGLSRAMITLLQCNTQYPTPYADVNLRAMATLASTFGVKAGYSDHTPGIAVPVAAVALGAAVIEKHFTLDRNLEGPDHAASLEPDELARMVGDIRDVEEALGSGIKRPSDSERENRDVARKSIVAARAIARGEIFSDDNLTAKRPGTGISPMRWLDVVGRPAPRDFEPDEWIEL